MGRGRGGLHALARSSCTDLACVPGIGSAKAARLVAALELGRRTLARAPGARTLIRSPRDAAAFLLPKFGARAMEQFGVVLLDAKHRVLRVAVIAAGTLNSTVVEPRDVFREAMLGGADADEAPSHQRLAVLSNALDLAPADRIATSYGDMIESKAAVR